MKRIGNLYEKICSIENLMQADKNAQRGKSKQYGVIAHNKNKVENIELLHQMLINKTYTTSPYETFTIFEPKEREIFRLPYFPDRNCHHAIMLVLEPMLLSIFTADTYSSIKGKGIHAASRAIKLSLKDVENTTYCLKLDLVKFYPSISHQILKELLRKKIKDKDLLWLLDGIIDSATGIPIGNYLSQSLATLYLTYFDHWIKETLRIKYYIRYADDIVVLSGSKEYLHKILSEIREYLDSKLKLTIKGNYQLFPVSARGIDFVGYVHYHTHTLLRKSIKQSFARSIARGSNKASIAPYRGWLKHGNCRNLENKLLKL